jgi:spastic paraplegia protein 7
MKVSIVPRTNNMLGYSQYMPKDRKLSSQDMMFEQMCLMLGGRVAESIIFNKVTSGAQDDLQKVTKLAYDQIRLYGMNGKVGLVSFPVTTENQFGSKPYSKQTSRLIDDEARKLVATVYRYTEKLLTDNKEKLRMVAEALLEREALTYRDMEQLVGPPSFGAKTLYPDWGGAKAAQPPPPSTTTV